MNIHMTFKANNFESLDLLFLQFTTINVRTGKKLEVKLHFFRHFRFELIIFSTVFSTVILPALLIIKFTNHKLVQYCQVNFYQLFITWIILLLFFFSNDYLKPGAVKHPQAPLLCAY